MGLKQRSKKLFRGWFPQEPEINKIAIVNGANTQNPQAADLHKYRKEISPTQNLNLLLAIAGWAVWLLISFGNLPSLNYAGLVAGGLAIGFILGLIPSYIELKKLTTTGSSSVKTSEILLVILFIAGPVLVLGSMAVEGIVYFYELQYSILTVYLSSLISSIAVRAFLFTAWERRNNADIMRGKTYAIISAQKAPSAISKRFFGKESRNPGIEQ